MGGQADLSYLPIRFVKLLNPKGSLCTSKMPKDNKTEWKASYFTYGLQIQQVYDSGTVFSPSVLDITDDDLRKRFMTGVSNLTCVSLAIGYPTITSIPHVVINGFKKLLALAASTDIEFKEAQTIKEYLADPSKFAVAAAPVAEAAPAAAETKAAEPAKKEESEESEDDDMGFGLFD